MNAAQRLAQELIEVTRRDCGVQGERPTLHLTWNPLKKTWSGTLVLPWQKITAEGDTVADALWAMVDKVRLELEASVADQRVGLNNADARLQRIKQIQAP